MQREVLAAKMMGVHDESNEHGSGYRGGVRGWPSPPSADGPPVMPVASEGSGVMGWAGVGLGVGGGAAGWQWDGMVVGREWAWDGGG